MEDQAFSGYRRPGARIGVRNRLLVIPTVVCSAHVCSRIAAALPGAVTIPHQHGCSQAGYDADLTAQVLEGLALNPNVGAALVVSLGCEVVDGAALTGRIAAQGTPAAFVQIQDAGGSLASIEAGIQEGKRLLAALRQAESAAVGLSDLVVGVRTGQADSTSPLLEKAVEEACHRILVTGGTVIRTGTGGNLGYGQRPPGPGLWVMEAPAQHEVEALTGLAAAGSTLVLYGTGAGTPIGSPVSPVVKITASPVAVADWGDHIDLDLREADDPAGAVLQALLAAAGDQETAAEVLGHAEFAIHRIGLTL